MAWVVTFLLRLLNLMPASMPWRLARRSAGFWMRLSPVKRHTTDRNLERCFPGMTPGQRTALGRESFVHYVCSVLETGHNWFTPIDELRGRCESFIGRELFEQALGSGRGMVVLAPHFGAWEYLGLFLQQYENIAILYKPPPNPGLEKALLKSRRRGGATMIAATATGIRKLYAHVRSGGGAGILPDQHPSRGQGRFVPFFGQQALTGTLAARLVQRTGCVVLASVCERLPGGRFRVHVLPVSDDVHSDDIEVSLAAVNGAIEDCIAIDPSQYLWSYRRFKKQPEGYPPFYDFR